MYIWRQHNTTVLKVLGLNLQTQLRWGIDWAQRSKSSSQIQCQSATKLKLYYGSRMLWHKNNNCRVFSEFLWDEGMVKAVIIVFI